MGVVRKGACMNKIVATVILLLLGNATGLAKDGLTLLLSNDDGYDAVGLRTLAAALRPLGQITVAAPAQEQSGKGHSITINEPVFVTGHTQPSGPEWYAIAAPPATCVRLALESLVAARPDVVVSGINRGANLGSSVYLSGTVGAAREAVIAGVPAIAVSIQGNERQDYAAAAEFVRDLVQQLHASGLLKPGLFLNVNVPSGERKGVAVTRLSVKPSREAFERRVSPRGQIYFWPTWKPLEDDAEGTDVWAFARRLIAVTPMTLDATAVAAMDRFRVLESQAAR